jgi:hypothetical protein
MVKILLDYEADLEDLSADECTPFMVASMNGRLPVMKLLKLLLEHKANVQGWPELAAFADEKSPKHLS